MADYTYASTQATNCAVCGEHKHTPLRVDKMGGYVCLTCIDKELERRLEPPEPSAQGPDELWLQLHGDCSDAELTEPVDYIRGDVTWCWHPINDSDVRYVRADLAGVAGGVSDGVGACPGCGRFYPVHLPGCPHGVPVCGNTPYDEGPFSVAPGVMPVGDARQQFEAWMRRDHPKHSLERTNYPGDHGEGDYIDGRTHEKWQTWQAARPPGVPAVVPPGKLVNGQWEGVPLSQFPELQEEVRKGLADGTLSVGGDGVPGTSNDQQEQRR